MSATNKTPIWDFLTNKHAIDFDLPVNDTINLHANTTQSDSSFSGFSESNAINDECKLINMHSYSNLLPLLKISSNNKIDLSELLLTQYQLSNLSLNKFTNNCALLSELRTYIQSTNDISSVQYNALNMFTKFLQTYDNICKPLPISNNIPNTFPLYNDKIDIVLQYMMEISNILSHNIVNANAKQFDVYFVPPNDTTDFTKFYMEGMGYSGPDSRYNERTGLDDIYSLFCSKQAHKLINDLQFNNNNRRLILLIVRGNEYNTHNDMLYLFNKSVSISNEYNLYNEILWNLNNMKHTICGKSLNNLFNISYHLHANNCKRMYVYYNGYGERICKRSIVNKLPFIFTGINGKDKINNYLLKQFLNEKNGFDDFIYTDINLAFGKYLFGLKYQRRTCNNIKQRLLNVPKASINANKVEIREFDDPQNQLYYYLTWTSKMQVLDGEFSEYKLRDGDCEFKEIAIFNSELHEKYSNGILYVVCILNNINTKRNGKPKWNMYQLMTSYQIYKTYGIISDDLPIGSRHTHNYFQQEITENNLDLCNDIIPVKNWNKVKIVLSQKFKGYSKPNLNDYNLNHYIQQAVNNIQSNKNNLSLIPILKIDTQTQQIICQTLIPVTLPNRNIAVSYNTLNKKIVINAVFIDPIDIINKAALVDAYAVNTYKYIVNTGSRTSVNSFEDVPSMPSMNKNWSIGSNQSNLSVQSITDQSWIIKNLQDQLNNALTRENMIVKMLTNSLPLPNTTTTLPSPNPSFTYNFNSLISPISTTPHTPIAQLPPSPPANYFNPIQLSFPNTSNTPILQQTTSPIVMPVLPTQIINKSVSNSTNYRSS